MLSDDYFEKYFNKGCAELTMYFTRHDCLDIRDEYMCSDNFCLGKWIKEVREAWNNAELSVKQIRRLELLGLARNSDEQMWEEMYKRAADYSDKKRIERKLGEADKNDASNDNSETEIPIGYKTEEGILLGAWADRQRKLCLSGNMCRDKEERLVEIGIFRRE